MRWRNFLVTCNPPCCPPASRPADPLDLTSSGPRNAVRHRAQRQRQVSTLRRVGRPVSSNSQNPTGLQGSEICANASTILPRERLQVSGDPRQRDSQIGRRFPSKRRSEGSHNLARSSSPTPGLLERQARRGTPTQQPTSATADTDLKQSFASCCDSSYSVARLADARAGHGASAYESASRRFNDSMGSRASRRTAAVSENLTVRRNPRQHLIATC